MCQSAYFFKELWPLTCVKISFSAQYLKNEWMEFNKI